MTTDTTTARVSPSGSTVATAGVTATAAAAALIAGGSYGNAHQWAAVPLLIGVAAVLGGIVFGVVTPRALRAVERRGATGTRWAVGFGIASVLTLAVFWTGAPLIVGTAGALMAATGRRNGARPAGPYTATLWLAGSAMAVTAVWTIVSSTVLSS
jgi:hypothetical protein